MNSRVRHAFLIYPWQPRGSCRLVALGSILLLCLAAVAPCADAASTRLPGKTCGRYTGPRWTISDGTGTQYSVYAVKGASCSLALGWAPRLGREKPHGADALLTGPAGWGCAAQLVLPHEGFCAQKSTGKVFGWGPVLTHSCSRRRATPSPAGHSAPFPTTSSSGRDSEVSMVARTSTWSGSPEALDKWADHVAKHVSGFVAALPGNAGGAFFLDREGGKALTLTYWESEEAAAETDKFADQSRASTVEATGVELVERGAYTVVLKL